MTDYELARTTKNPDVLNKLACDKDEDVRWDVARNPNTPKQTLNTLSKDKNEYVRWDVARNPATPAQTLNTLSKDKDVKQEAIKQLKTRKLNKQQRAKLTATLI